MSSDRSHAQSFISFPIIRFGGVVSCIGVSALFFSISSAAADCDIRDVTKESNVTKSVQENFERLASCVKELQARLDKVQNSSGYAKIRGTDGSVASDTGSVNGLAGTYSLDNDAFVACPPGTFVSAIQGFAFNGQKPIVQIRYACRSVK